ncbi:MAG TPA: HDOD domain-containing protein [Myxococcaceae bacterium]|nr:HDOD domain-containing protein [Myxococcaceae bacterium]
MRTARARGGALRALWDRVVGRSPPVAQPRRAPEPKRASDQADLSEVLGVDLSATPPAAAEPSPEEVELTCQLLERFNAESELQAFPAAALEVLRLVSEPELRLPELLRTIQQDPALGWAVMQVAHSAAYQGLSEVQTLKAAVTRLGANEVGRVAGVVAARALFHPRSRAQQAAFRPRRRALYHRSVAVARVSSALSLDAPGGQPERAYLGGLLHGVGRALALRALASLAADGTLSIADEDPRVDRLLGLVQGDLATEALRRWSLPEYVRSICALGSDLGVPSGPDWVDLHAVRVPAALWAWKHEPQVLPRAPWVVSESALALGLSARRVHTLERELLDAAKASAALLDQLAES